VSQTVRAHEYVHSRGGSAPAVLSVLSQPHADKCWLVANLGSSQEARGLARELEAEGVSMWYCKVWEGAGVPAAWILHAGACLSLSALEGGGTYF
jgi:sugar/nucleoside kinase (ribokinase family)